MTDVATTSARAATTKPSRALSRILRHLHALDCGVLIVETPDGARHDFRGAQPGPHASVAIRSLALLRRLGAGDVGLAEAYIAGEWTTPSLVDVLQLLAANQTLIDRFLSNPVARLAQMVRHWLNRNSRAGSRRNIRAHYDLGNAFYAQWLDESMTYSSGLEVDGDLRQSQERKYAELFKQAGVQANERVLEIGCGWGGFAEHAARRGAHVTGLTISREQLDYAQARLSRAGLADRADIVFRDYRDERGTYDRIVSIEMFEAVGEAYWSTFFDVAQKRLAPGGRLAMQAITIREDIFPRYRREMDFIRRYIFPGGMLPTVTALERLGADAGLRLVHRRAFGGDYAETCKLWRQRFETMWPRIAPLGFDEAFYRTWTYYLSYCEAGFRAGTIDVQHVVYEKASS